MAKNKSYGVVGGFWVKAVGYKMTSSGKVSAATFYLSKCQDDPKALGADVKAAALRAQWASGEGVAEIDHDGRRVKVWADSITAAPAPPSEAPRPLASPSSALATVAPAVAAPVAPVGGLTVGKAISDYLESECRIGKSHGHYVTTRYRLQSIGDTLIDGVKLADLPLRDYDERRFRLTLEHVSSRPVGRRGTTISVSHAKGCLHWFRYFLLWANDSLIWSRPPHFDKRFKECKPKDTDAEKDTALDLRAQQGDDGRYFPIDDLGLLYSCANDRTRLWMLLMLNCGFGPAELNTLRRKEIVGLDTATPYIHRQRGKTNVYAKWGYLFPELVTLLRRFIAEDAISPDDFVLKTSDGKRLIINKVDKNGKPSSRYDGVYAVWRCLMLRAKQGDKPRDLSPKYIRKTGARLLRFSAGLSPVDASFLASLYLSHGDEGDIGEDGRADKVLSSYSERDWDRLTPALKGMREQLQPIFDAKRPTSVRSLEQVADRKAIMAKARAVLASMKAERKALAVAGVAVGATVGV